MAALGFMAELVQGSAHWLAPTLMGIPTENPAVLPYWLGAWAMQLTPTSASADFAVRPFALLMALAMVATWYGTYYLARNPLAQPVAFALGGEALPADYARAMADGGLLAFIACLGLAQLSMKQHRPWRNWDLPRSFSMPWVPCPIADMARPWPRQWV